MFNSKLALIGCVLILVVCGASASSGLIAQDAKITDPASVVRPDTCMPMRKSGFSAAGVSPLACSWLLTAFWIRSTAAC